VSRNSYSIAATLGEVTGTFCELKIIGFDQSFPYYYLNRKRESQKR